MKPFGSSIIDRVLVVLLITLLTTPVPAFAFNWVTANQATIQWNAVTADLDGDPIPAGTHVEYKVLLVNKITDPGKTNPSEVAQVTGVEHTITLNVKGQYLVGVRPVHIEDGTGALLAQADISWSDVPGDCIGGQDFGIRFFAALQKTLIGPKPAL